MDKKSAELSGANHLGNADGVAAPYGHTQRTSVVLWPGQAIQGIYWGMGLALALHCHHAVQISISLGAPLRVRTHTNESYTEQQSFVVGPNISHQVDTTGVPTFTLFSEAHVFADLARRLSATPTSSSLPALPESVLNDLLPVILASGGHVLNAQAVQAILSHILTILVGSSLLDESPDDPRIATARSLVTPQFLIEESQPILYLATSVHLSPSRFRHLFTSEMGLSVQSYLRWQRLLAAMRTSAYGASFTEAAHSVGFADSAHLTRVFRAAFGLPPSHIFKDSHAVQVIRGSEC